MRILANQNFNFIRWRWHAIALSVLIIAVGLFAVVKRGGLPLGIDFSGGTVIELKFAQPVGEEAVRSALGDHKGIRRYGSATLPMDEALVTVAMDLSGRPYFVWKVPLPKAKIGTWDVELAEVFFEAFARTAQANLHVVLQDGHNLHHIVEITFKAFSKALRMATELDPRAPGVPSTKGMLV